MSATQATKQTTNGTKVMTIAGAPANGGTITRRKTRAQLDAARVEAQRIADRDPMSAPRGRLVIYARLSHANAGSSSIDDQLRLGREWAAANNHDVVAELIDDGISASRHSRIASRPGWDELLRLVDTQPPTTIYLWELSRGDRKVSGIAHLLDRCESGDVGLMVQTLGRVLRSSDSNDRMMLHQISTMDQASSDYTAARVRRAIESQAQRGGVHAHPPYGMRVDVSSDGRTRTWVEDEITGPHARWICSQVDAGVSLRRIADELNARGVLTRYPARIAALVAAGITPTPEQITKAAASRGWTANGVRSVSTNAALRGVRLWGDQAIESSWPAIVDGHPDAVRSEMTRAIKSPATKHLLSGLVICGGCGGRLQAARADRYRCSICNRVGINGTKLDAYVFQHVRSLVAGSQGESQAQGASVDPLVPYVSELARIEAALAIAYNAGALDFISYTDAVDAAQARVERTAKVSGAWERAELRDARAILTEYLENEVDSVTSVPERGSVEAEAVRTFIRAYLLVSLHPTKPGTRPAISQRVVIATI